MADIDIDFRTDFDPKRVFKQIIPASIIKNDDLEKHNCGHYFQTIPVDPVTGLAAIPYEEAEVLGYFKIDFLHLAVLDNFTSKDEIRKLIRQSPDWTLLLHEEHVSKLFQVHKRADLLKRIRPNSVQELADCIALIRPSKKYLINRYVTEINNRETIQRELYEKPTEGGSKWFKKAHAISYALTIVLQLHLIQQGKL